MHSYSSIDTTSAWKKLRFILLDRSDFHMIDNLSIAVLSVDETLLPRYVNLSTNFSDPPFRVIISTPWLKHMYSVLSAFTGRQMAHAACFRPFSILGNSPKVTVKLITKIIFNWRDIKLRQFTLEKRACYKQAPMQSAMHSFFICLEGTSSSLSSSPLPTPPKTTVPFFYPRSLGATPRIT